MTVLPAGAAAGKPLRIAYLFSQYPLPTQTFAQSDIAALRELGHEVTVFTMKPPRGAPGAERDVRRPSLRGALRWPDALAAAGAALPHIGRIIAANALSAPRTAATALASLPRAAEIADAITREGFDVVHLFWARHAGLVLPLLAARRAPAVRSVFVGAYDLVADDFLVRLSLGAADLAVSHAEINRPYLETMVPAGTPTAIIRRGIPLLPHAPHIARDRALWVTASALVPEKNVEGVIRAFAAAQARGAALRLEIYGEGPDRPRLESLCRELGCEARVTFAGHVDRAALFAAMQRASLFILLSRKPSERLPNVVKEALWAGCMVISSNSAGIEELLPDRALGLVVDPDDAEAVARAVDEVMQRDPASDDARIKAARAHVAEHFCATRNMAAYAEHWQRLMRRQASAS